jgi:hypothetical protein
MGQTFCQLWLGFCQGFVANQRNGLENCNAVYGGQGNSIDNTFSGFSVEKIRLRAMGALQNE